MCGRGPSLGAPAPPTRPLPHPELFFVQDRFPLFSTACALFTSLFCTRAKRISFSFSRLCTLCVKPPGVTHSVSFNFRASTFNSPLTLAESALTDECRVLAENSRKQSLATRL